MPSAPKPKTFVAATSFRWGRHHYAAGEAVEDRRVIERLVHFGDRFITPQRSKTQAVDTATPQQPESTKED